jgi:hypothetical protein
LDASGFLEHLKLPHYVTFRSMVDRKRAVRAAKRVRPATNGPRDEGTAGQTGRTVAPPGGAGLEAATSPEAAAGGDCAEAQPAGGPVLSGGPGR